VPEPLLHLGDVGVVIERIGCGSRAQGMGPDLKSEPARISAHEFVDAVRRDRLIEARGPVVAERSEQRAGIVSAVTGRAKIVIDQALGRRM
jgi:hypothetical protein